MPTPLRSALLALILTGLAACSTMQPVPRGPIETLHADIGKNLNDIFIRYGSITAYERTYSASEATGEFRAPIRKRYPPNDPRSAFVTIREVWWSRSDQFYSYFFVKRDKQWIAIEAFKWRGRTRFENQEKYFPTY